MISVNNLSKNFGDFKALKNISFEAAKGEIIGFLGQNGAGKTTLMRVLTTFMPAGSGRVVIAGKDVSKYPIYVRKKIGYLPENPPIYTGMTVKNYLKFSARLKDVRPKQQDFEVDRVISVCSLSNVKFKEIGILSRGYRQRIGIAQAIINDPQILILDEPTNGLDPVQVIQVRDLIKNLETKRTVIVSTHILSEIEKITKRAIIIKSGEIIADDSIENLLKKTEQRKIFLKAKGDLEKIENALTQNKTIEKYHIEQKNQGFDITIYNSTGEIYINDFLKNIINAGVQVFELKEVNPTLEDVFLDLNK